MGTRNGSTPARSANKAIILTSLSSRVSFFTPSGRQVTSQVVRLDSWSQYQRHQKCQVFFISSHSMGECEQQCQINDLSRSEASVLLLSFQKRSNVNVFKSKFWIETKRFLSDLKIIGPKAYVLFRFQKYFKLSKHFVLISKQLEENKNVPNQ